jgi:hypothetical protein
MSQRGTKGSKSKHSMILGLIGLFVSLAAWAVSSPLGSSPDDDFHLASIWCAENPFSKGCSVQENGALIPNELMVSHCFAFKTYVSGACTEIASLKTEKYRTTHVNNIKEIYPGIFYKYHSLLKSENIKLSNLLMRVSNIIFLLISVVLIFYTRGKSSFSVKYVWSLILPMIPLGMFIVPSTNPSSWSYISGVTLFALFLILMNPIEEKQKNYLILLPILAYWTTLNFSRADGSYFSIIICLGLILKWFSTSRNIRNLMFLLTATLASTLILVQQNNVEATVEGGLNLGIERDGQTSSLDIFKFNVMHIFYFFKGAFGFTGLGWLDTYVPAFVWIVLSLYVSAVIVYSFFSLLKQKRIYQMASTLFIAFSFLATPIIVLQLNKAFTGEIVQARYVLPLLPVIILSLIEDQDFKSIDWRNIVLLSLPILFVTYSISLMANINRYSSSQYSGIDIRSLFYPSWNYFNLPPIVTLLVGCIGFFLAIASFSFCFFNSTSKSIQKNARLNLEMVNRLYRVSVSIVALSTTTLALFWIANDNNRKFVSNTRNMEYVGTATPNFMYPLGELRFESGLSQTFFASQNNLKGFDLFFSTYAKVNRGRLAVEFWEDVDGLKNLIYSKELEQTKIIDNRYIKFRFPALVSSKDKKYEIRVFPIKKFSNEFVTLWNDNIQSIPGGLLTVNGSEVPGNLAFKVYYIPGELS